MTKKTKKLELEVVKNEEEIFEPTNKPTPEEVEQFKNDFQDAVVEFNSKKWAISEPGSFGANDVAIFIKNFMNKYAFWSQTAWMGMIKMDEELDKALALVNDETALELNYQALEFCAYMLSNPGGIGVQIAREFELIADKYSKIGMVVGEKLEEARDELKNIQYLQERWAAGEQGFYMADLEPPVEEELGVAEDS